ncbi:hypothetical protein FHS31_001266 [Sphingomonas vulcanisoli]|uniref:Chemotaxis protein n=1 Tax=Sphingomonas vulcanisoli TaxID=1658060 RepID=A0ABX0TT30_9SPHN|nr:hypothetical protein [Sphingomonas vulcanisoli]NIJ07670.1 hypothetical protein [Sphingomonas vulcanisoli]
MLNEQCKALAQAVDNLQVTQTELGRIARRSDDQRQRDLIAQRRILGIEVAKVSETASALLEQVGDPVLLADYRRLFSAMRTMTAAHQANWSAVRVGERGGEYMRSAREAAEVFIQLMEWIRATIADIAKR